MSHEIGSGSEEERVAKSPEERGVIAGIGISSTTQTKEDHTQIDDRKLVRMQVANNETSSERDSGISVTSTRADTYGDTVSSLDSEEQKLVRACRNGDLNTVKKMVQSGNLDLHECKDKEHNDTPLHWASYYGHKEIVAYLIENGCIVNCKNIFGNTPLHRAAEGKSGNENVVRYLVEQCECDPTCSGQYNRTPLHKACKKGNIKTVKYLMSKIPVDMYMAREYKHGYTPLDLAAQHGTLDVVKYMVEEKKCNQPVSSSSEKRYTPLHYAAYGGNLYIVKYLIENGKFAADVRGRWNRTPLHSACLRGELDVVKYLAIERGVDPSCQEDNGETPLHSAVIGGNLSVVRLMIQTYMCDQFKKDNKGQTPLHLAEKYKHTGISEYLKKSANAYGEHIIIMHTV